MQLVLDEVLKNIENKSDISLISIIGNYTTSSMNTFDMILSISGLLAILIFLLISKLINI